ncbi:MAG: hypothetical protein LRS46_01295 [Desulfurococcales archaeon]|nr:hypothetical protein [Desulfurococcales archaeon]
MAAPAASRMPPVVELVSFDSVTEFNKFLDEEISKLRGQLGEFLRRLEAAKAKAEVMAKIESFLAELARGQGGGELQGRQLQLGPISVIVNPTPKQELDALVATARSLQERIVTLEKIKKSLEPLQKMPSVDVKVEVLMENRIPTRVFLRI